MESNNRTAEIQELCHIYYKRNQLGKKRDSLRHKYRYLQDVKRSLQVRDNFKSSQFFQKLKIKYPHDSGSMIVTERNEAARLAERAAYLKDNPIPKRFTETSLSEMNMLILEAEAKVCKIKLDVMKHTHKYQKRVDLLLKKLECHPHYVCGNVTYLLFSDDESWSINAPDFKKYHDEFLANKAVDKMLRG